MPQAVEALEAGLLALGFAVAGSRETADARMARRVLVAATSADPQLADAWLARLAAGDRSLGVYRGLWASRNSIGRALGHYGLRPENLNAKAVLSSLIEVKISDPDRAAAAYVAALTDAGDYDAAVEVFEPMLADPAAVFTRYAATALFYKTERWPQVAETAWPLRDFSDEVLAAAARTLSGHAQACLGMHQAAVASACDPLPESGKTITELIPAATADVCYFLAGCYRALGDEAAAQEALRTALVANPGHRAAAEMAADRSLQLTTVDPAAIMARSDPWDPTSRPTEQAGTDDAARRAEVIAEATALLDEQIGLAGVKREVMKLAALAGLNQSRVAAGLPEIVKSNHLVLTGPPGTGKTTVGEVVAKLYYGHGILSSPKLISVTPVDLVRGFLGQTAIQTNEVVDSALDGVLMIDEAYSLVDPDSPGASSYGKQAVDTLLARIENDRHRLVVILAGYPDEMTTFLATNPGLASRFSKRIAFPSYSADELVQIAHLVANKTQSTLAPAAAAVLSRACTYLTSTQVVDPSPPGVLRQAVDVAANARFVRNVVEEALVELALRLSAGGGPGIDDPMMLTQITEADMTAALDVVLGAAFGEVPAWQ